MGLSAPLFRGNYLKEGLMLRRAMKRLARLRRPMKTLLLATVLLVSSVVLAAEPPAPDPAIEMLKQQIVSLDKDLRIYELSYELAKQQREKLVAELERKMPKPESKR
jgi:hypothetical protein